MPHRHRRDRRLPENFGFLIEGELAGSGTPLMTASLPRTFQALRDAGIGAILSLDEHGLPGAVLDEFGFAHRHEPIADFTAPSIEQVIECVRFIDDNIRRGAAVLAHCHMGWGRTGTILACYLVQRENIGGRKAIDRVRRARPGSIETGEQEDLIFRFADHHHDREA